LLRLFSGEYFFEIFLLLSLDSSWQVWQEHLDLVEQLRKTQRGNEIYSLRKETIERVFADAKENE